MPRQGPTTMMWISGGLMVVLLALAVVAATAGYALFAIAAAVLSVFAAVELRWLRRDRRRP